MFVRSLLLVIAVVVGVSCTHVKRVEGKKQAAKKVAIALALAVHWEKVPPFQSKILTLDGRRASVFQRWKQQGWSVSILPTLLPRKVVKLLLEVKRRRPDGSWQLLSRPTIITRLGMKATLSTVLRKGQKPLSLSILPTLTAIKAP